MSKYAINDCFGIRAYVTAPVNQPMARVAEIAMSHTNGILSKIEGISVTTHKVKSSDTDIELHMIYPNDYNGSRPCIIDIHGGGFVFDGAPHMYEYAARYAKETGAIVAFPRYRLTPRNKYPAQLDDCFATYDFVKNNAKSLGVDTNKIAVMGDSAGGYLAGRTVNYAISKGDKLIFQLLIYPVTDTTMSTESMEKFIDTPVWNAKNNKSMWRMYFGKSEIDRTSQSLLYMDIPERIPVTYIETAEFDCLHDEGVLYYKRLLEMGVNVTLNETKETMHGFDEVKCDITENAIRERIKFINSVLHEG